jgi:hypothetical protein
MCGMDSNTKGVGKTVVFPLRKEWENRGFPRGSSPSPAARERRRAQCPAPAGGGYKCLVCSLVPNRGALARRE